MMILVVEDEKDLLYLLRDNLVREGHKVVTAENGLQALRILKELKIDLGIFDVMMPEMDGFHLLQIIRNESDMPVIFLTARTEEIDRIYGLSLGADDYLVKPFSMAELKARVNIQNRHLQKYRAQAENVNEKKEESQQLACGELRMNLSEAVVFKKGKEIPLLAKEFMLLRLFMEHPGCVYTKKQLYRIVWEDDYLYDDNTIMVHISRLRAKIETNPKEPEYLVTVRGVGYKMQKH
ncbi:MAG: response regulator transcription factor [Lachnospiraceae bacterium]|nr:response regulator transcription factor [Lachnospiraceae bacterium]